LDDDIYNVTELKKLMNLDMFEGAI